MEPVRIYCIKHTKLEIKVFSLNCTEQLSCFCIRLERILKHCHQIICIKPIVIRICQVFQAFIFILLGFGGSKLRSQECKGNLVQGWSRGRVRHCPSKRKQNPLKRKTKTNIPPYSVATLLRSLVLLLSPVIQHKYSKRIQGFTGTQKWNFPQISIFSSPLNLSNLSSFHQNLICFFFSFFPNAVLKKGIQGYKFSISTLNNTQAFSIINFFFCIFIDIKEFTYIKKLPQKMVPPNSQAVFPRPNICPFIPVNLPRKRFIAFPQKLQFGLQ